MKTVPMNTKVIQKNSFRAAALSIGLLLFACASAPVRPVVGYTPAIGEKAARTAVAMIDRPYKYRGDSPEGFDCSGLVRYSYLTAGLDVPHGTKQLVGTTRPVSLRSVRKGDLLFFDEKGGKYSHVGIYIGHSTFVHAPHSGLKVRKDSLRSRYWKKSFSEARRFP
jgi:cell wall-associated NlpC family hydrolase